MPVILRIDGCHFHSYTKGCKKPVDEGLVECMNDTAIELCKSIQGAQLAYVQSDEISLLLVNYKSIDTQSWFDNNIQKMASISASIAAATFTMNSYKIWGFHDDGEGTAFEGMGYTSPIIKPAYFDSRVFVIPKEDVNNYFLWRQNDAIRNSVQMLARSLYSHKECENKNNPQLQEMCFQKGHSWNYCPTSQKRGRCIVKQKIVKKTDFCDNQSGQVMMVERSVWAVDNEIPVFSDDKMHINNYVYPKMIINV
jgi:tRNA(His) 5'-end guanylyltransferase